MEGGGAAAQIAVLPGAQTYSGVQERTRAHRQVREIHVHLHDPSDVDVEESLLMHQSVMGGAQGCNGVRLLAVIAGRPEIMTLHTGKVQILFYKCYICIFVFYDHQRADVHFHD